MNEFVSPSVIAEALNTSNYQVLKTIIAERIPYEVTRSKKIKIKLRDAKEYLPELEGLLVDDPGH